MSGDVRGTNSAYTQEAGTHLFPTHQLVFVVDFQRAYARVSRDTCRCNDDM